LIQPGARIGGQRGAHGEPLVIQFARSRFDFLAVLLDRNLGSVAQRKIKVEHDFGRRLI
jgi:hypothetical protein